MKRIYGYLSAIVSLAFLTFPEMAAAAGAKGSALIVVADARTIHWSFWRFWVDLYNADPFMFAVWTTVFTATMGVSLGLITDFFMRRTGIDLTSRKIVEH